MNVEKEAQPFHPTSQVLLRNLTALTGSEILVVNYPCDRFLLLLKERSTTKQVVGFTYDYVAHLYAHTLLRAARYPEGDLHYGAFYPAQRQYDRVIIYLPKSQLLIRMILQMAATLLPTGARLWLVGENNAGIRSSEALLDELIGPTRKVDAARHCSLFQATMKTAAAPFNLEEWGASYQAEINHRLLTIRSFPGVFSYGRLDEGTQLLLSTFTQPLAGRILDFGCGSGIIGAALKYAWADPMLEMIDSNALALAATNATLAANRVSAEGVYPSNVFSDVRSTYHWIISNPPFHEGVAVNYQAVTTFLREAAHYLEPEGRLRIVANRFLKYQPLIETQVGKCQILAENQKYRVYEAIRQE